MSIKFNSDLIIEEIISYPPAGNDVFECIGKIKDKPRHMFLKISRSDVADIENEVNILPKLLKFKIRVPKVLDWGRKDDHDYILTSKVYGSKLSTLVKRGANIRDYLFCYGRALAQIHALDMETKKAKQRKINNIPEFDIEEYPELKGTYDYLISNQPMIEFDAFIHGDFHYGNVLFKNKNINAIIDWEYSGIGFKEQDIAWALILRPTQKFLNTYEEIEMFLRGYQSLGTYNEDKFKWCYINGCVHFYLMNKNNLKYKQELLRMIELVKQGQ